MERILIDGYNLLYKDGVLKNLAERSLEEAREQLLDTISAYRTGTMEILVVFDGARPSPTRSASGRAGVQVRFSASTKTADQVILELIQREPRRASLTVVTSDKKDIGRIASAEGVRWISSETFLRRLRRAVKPKPVADREKPAGTSAEELKYWLRRFGSDPSEGD
ncbi:MAG: NYN domain-containing protein [Acidobacteria bacterium]|nr:NYN domain-containing protein [Acidobacteriota bacterium]